MTKARQTVCPIPVGTLTDNIMWNDAEAAAALGHPAVSPFKKGSPHDRAWLRHYNKATRCIAISGFTQIGMRAA